MFSFGSSFFLLIFLLGWVAGWGRREAQAQAPNPLDEKDSVAVLVGPEAPELERFAAAQLCDYLEALFGLRTQPTVDLPETAEILFLVGSSATNPAVQEATAGEPSPPLSDQSIILRRRELRNRPA